MPYKKNADVPDGVKVLPDDGITIWRKAFNAALKQYGDEETAIKVAWAAVKKKYKKDGDKWVLKEGVDMSYEQTMEKLRQALNDRFQVGDDARQGFGLDEHGGILSDHLLRRRHFHEPEGGVVGEEDRTVPVHDQGGVEHVFHHRPEYLLFLGGN